LVNRLRAKTVTQVRPEFAGRVFRESPGPIRSVRAAQSREEFRKSARLPTRHAAVILLAGAACGAFAQDMMFGEPADTSFAQSLWQAMESAGLAGEGAVHALPYQGTDPRGAWLETLNASIDVEGETGLVIVKRNHMPTDGGAAAVWADPAAYLAAITVMFTRPGFDPDNQDWFWARYAPDGSLAMTDGGVAVAGRVDGCIGCHSAAGGGDYIYVND
jgi:hypothetical protein